MPGTLRFVALTVVKFPLLVFLVSPSYWELAVEQVRGQISFKLPACWAGRHGPSSRLAPWGAQLVVRRSGSSGKSAVALQEKVGALVQILDSPGNI